jgi:hypothetical protein
MPIDSPVYDGLIVPRLRVPRWLLRVFMSWRGYVDEWAYVRTMLVRTQRLKFLHKVYVHWYAERGGAHRQ